MIITLPVTVKNGAPLGYWLTPTVADALARQLGERGICYYGKLGLKRPSPDEEFTYLKNLDFLGISCERETDATHAQELLGLCEDLASAGTLESRSQDCFRCPCGCLELPVSIAAFAKEKTFVRVNGGYACRACSRPGTVQRMTGRFLRLGACATEDIGVYPGWYRGEVNDLEQQLAEQGIPWSRERPDGSERIDPEVVWSLIPLLLSRKFPGERVRIVVTNHVLRQALVTVWVARALDSDFTADLVVLPCLDHPGSAEKWNLARLTSLGYSGALLRYMLIGSLGWQGKNARLYDVPAAVEYRRFQLLERLARKAEGSHESPYVLADALRNLNQQNMAQGLKHVFNPEKFDYRTLSGVL